MHDDRRAQRRAHQCHCEGCDSPAAYDVYLHIRYGWHLVAVEHLKSSIRVCDTREHRKKAHDYILSEHNKTTITRELAKIGRLSLDWPNAMIEFVPCGEISWSPDKMMPLAVA